MKNKKYQLQFSSLMLAFFTMGFVDLVGIATNYIKNDFSLNDATANSVAAMVFLWFLIFSVPTGMLMNRIGRKKTVIWSIVITFLSLIIPSIKYNFSTVLISFSLLGIGNTLMQVSLNPLVSNIVRGNRLASTLTFGQFIKAIASFTAPIVAAWSAVKYGDWKMLFPLFAVVAIIAIVTLYFTKIEEAPVSGKPSTFLECFSLLKDPYIATLFMGIMVHVGIDVGINITAPKLLIERENMELAQAGYATSVFFFFRTLGCLAGSFILAHFPAKKFFNISVLIMIISMIGMYFSYSAIAIYICVALIGFGNSNIFPIIFSQALVHLPARNNEISGLMIMGIFGGAIFPFLMGVASDFLRSQIGAVIVLTFCVTYLVLLSPKIRKI